MAEHELVPELPIRVLVVDDHDLFRAKLSSMLQSQPDMEVVAQASGGRMAVRLARELSPEVVLMDLNMPDLDGDEATRQILGQDPHVRVLVLTITTEEAALSAAVHAGASGYLVKESPVEEVYAAVRAAAAGNGWLSSRAAIALLEQIRTRGQAPEVEPGAIGNLSARELQVLGLIARGHENADIAAELGISSRTAKNHVSSILGKLELDNRVQAAVFAARHGLD